MRYEIKLSSREMAELQDHLRGPEYAACLYEIVTQFRDKSKHSNTPETTWGDAYDLLWAILEEHNVDPFN